MKKLSRRILALALAASLLLGGGAMAGDMGKVGDESYAGTTIDINTKFDFIMQYVDWFSLGAEGQDVLRQYFNQYFQKHPEEFTALVNDVMQSIDSHSMYMSAEEYAATFGQTLSDYIGVGVTLKAGGGGLLEEVAEFGPAYEAGVRAGDVLVKIDDTSVVGKQNSDMAVLLRGAENTKVRLTVRRAGKELTFTVTRRSVTPEHVASKTLAKGVEYIRISAMGSEQDTAKFVSIWNKLPAKDTRAAIIDLRGNGGGLISMAQKMVETIVPAKGVKYLALRQRKDSGGLTEYYTPGGGPKLNKIIVLVDGGTASASEIVSGALSDLGEATLLGEPTYGKGVGQYHMPMPDGSMLILTSLEMQLPKRGAYEGTGLKPDLHIVADGTKTSAAETLLPLDTTKPLLPGDRTAAVAAMTQRLSLLGYLDSAPKALDAAVLDAVRRYARACGQTPAFYAAPELLTRLDAAARAQQAGAQGLDNQLATALELCKLAAAKPAQYTVNADGTWTNR